MNTGANIKSPLIFFNSQRWFEKCDTYIQHFLQDTKLTWFFKDYTIDANDYEYDGTEITNEEFVGDSGECDSCRNSVNTLFTIIREESSKTKTLSNFTEVLCPVLKEQTNDCEEKVNSWWPNIAEIIYAEEFSAGICQKMDPGCNHE